MKAERFLEYITGLGIDTFAGVPDSTLKEFCNVISGSDRSEGYRLVFPNEGSAVGYAAGTYLATGKPACVYMQNSGVGNAVNPVTSLLHSDVYGIPMLFVIGWRGDDGEKADEPQHRFMGKITQDICTLLQLQTAVIDKATSEAELSAHFSRARQCLAQNGLFAFLVKRETFDHQAFPPYRNEYTIIREEAIEAFVRFIRQDDIVVSTTGKISRELYEQSKRVLQQSAQNFLTVGSMGHASMIALGLAEKMPEKRVFCLDGDGAALMHLGTLPTIAERAPRNFVHICINNRSHDSVGGMPTSACGLEYGAIAGACGYPEVLMAESMEELSDAFKHLDVPSGPVFLEIKTALKSRPELGRPKETAEENKFAFMKYHGVI